MRKEESFFFIFIFVAILTICFSLLEIEKFNFEISQISSAQLLIPLRIKGHPRTLFFVGDMMFDRGIEFLIRKKGVLYPFEKIESIFREMEIVAGNLEGPIVENPPNFGPYSLTFAFSPEILKGLSFAHFNLVFLANNHTNNMGREGLKETKEFLRREKIDFVGDPINCEEKNVLLEKDGIIFLAFNKTFPINCDGGKIVKLVENVRNKNPQKFLITILHWGEEYQKESSPNQRKLAHQLIDAGSDLIIGSHPHVVQEIEEYKGNLIFYSLGNLIFDQYFSKETQEGLGVKLEIYPQKLIFRLFPFQSYLGQPSLMEKEKSKEFFFDLSKKSTPKMAEKIKDGIIKIERGKNLGQ